MSNQMRRCLFLRLTARFSLIIRWPIGPILLEAEAIGRLVLHNTFVIPGLGVKVKQTAEIVAEEVYQTHVEYEELGYSRNRRAF